MKNKLFIGFLFLLISVSSAYGIKWYAEKNACVKVPANFHYCNGAPFVDVLIEDKLYLGLIAFSKFPLSANRSLLREIQIKEPAGFQKGHNGDGKIKRSKAFALPEVSIGSIKWKNVLAVEAEEEHAPDNLDTGPCPDPVFSIGRAFFERANLLINFKEGKVFAAKSVDILQKKGLFPKNALKIPIEKNSLGEVIILVETTFRPLRLALHTNWGYKTRIKPDLIDKKKSSLFDGEQVFETSSLKIGGYDFGQLHLHPSFDAPVVDFDGYLGMEFLGDRKIYIDYPNGFIYIAK